MLFGGALVAKLGHTLLGAGAFSNVSAGFGLGGGAGAARKHRTGQNKSGDEEDKETKPKCHGSHYHLGYPGFCFYLYVLCDFRPFVCRQIISLVRCTGQNKRGATGPKKSTIDARGENLNTYCDSKGNFPSRTTVNSPSTEVSNCLSSSSACFATRSSLRY